MFPQHGFIDTITDFSGVNHDSALAKIFINPYAAVPSMHCAFALMIGVTGVAVCRHWWSKACWALWPLLIAWVVIVTANHYWVDVGARLDGRGRRGRWSPSGCWPAPGPRPGPGAPPRRRRRPRPEPTALATARDRSLTAMESSAPPRAPGGRRNGRQRPQRPGASLLRPRAPDRVAADPERDLDGRPDRQPGRRRPGHPAPLLPRRRRLHPRLGDGHARRPLLADVGQGDAVRRLPRLDPGPDRGGDRARRGRRLLRRHAAKTSPRRCAWSPCSAR